MVVKKYMNLFIVLFGLLDVRLTGTADFVVVGKTNQ